MKDLKDMDNYEIAEKAAKELMMAEGDDAILTAIYTLSIGVFGIA